MPKPIWPASLITPHWMSFCPPCCSLAMTAGEFQPVVRLEPICVVLIQKVSEAAPISGAVVWASSATKLPAPSKRRALPAAPSCPATHTGATAAGEGVESVSEPVWALYRSVVAFDDASSKVQRPTEATLSVGEATSFTGCTSTATAAVSLRPPEVTV